MMLKLYRENKEFSRYSRFNTLTGELLPTDEEYFVNHQRQLPFFDGGNTKTHTNFPRRIYFQITRNCNLKCGYCFLKADSNGAHLDAEVIFRMAEYFEKKGLMEVRLTGGEPTIHPDFQSIYKKFQKLHIYVSVATNGVWAKSTLDFLSGLKYVWIVASIDGDRDIHNTYRNNSYDTVITNLNEFKRRNPSARLRINTVLTKENTGVLEHLVQLTAELDAESITLIPLRPQVRIPSEKEKMLDASQFKDAIERMVRYKETYGINFTTTIETRFKDDIMPDKIFTKKSSCAAGREGTNLDFDSVRKKLIMYACSYCPASDLLEKYHLRKPFLAGEFDYGTTEEFGKIWDDDDKWTLFRDPSLKSDNCRGCEELGRRCTGSCPIQNVDLSKIRDCESAKQDIMSGMRKNAEWYCYKSME